MTSKADLDKIGLTAQVKDKFKDDLPSSFDSIYADDKEIRSTLANSTKQIKS